MTVEQINALSQVAIGSLLILAAIIFVVRLPQNAEAVKGIVLEIREASELGLSRVEGANNVLMEAVKVLKETSGAAIESRNRLEARYDALTGELNEVKRTFEAQIKAKDEEIARLRAELEQERAKKAQVQADLDKAIQERTALQQRLDALERADKAPEAAKPVDKSGELAA